MSRYVYIQSQRACADNDWHELYTVGWEDSQGRWHSESDWLTRGDAAKRVAWLNGSGEVQRTLDQALNSGDGSYKP